MTNPNTTSGTTSSGMEDVFNLCVKGSGKKSMGVGQFPSSTMLNVLAYGGAQMS